MTVVGAILSWPPCAMDWAENSMTCAVELPEKFPTSVAQRFPRASNASELTELSVVWSPEMVATGAATPLAFDAMAAADADANQTVTLEELRAVPAQSSDEDGGIINPDAGVDAGAPSIADVLYEVLVQHIVRLGDSGPCDAEGRFR